ncbi:MAG: toll/interleukin-1 receptor domain-containing protein [Symploca sp. SIO2G7]|nr:toll/interleukin-1 receptor domain-containing protein [Symploca sp. SIO2G7]
MKYQLITVGPLIHEYADSLETELLRDFEELGLDNNRYFEILGSSHADQINWDGTPVMVWFGGSGQEEDKDIELLNSFLEFNHPVFPVVKNLKKYADNVPPTLHKINGIEWDEARLAADILRAFRLSRKQRQAFISYRRTETRAVAVQLFAELSLHGYRAFLDTASVESGVDFQEALWGRMADVDLLIFLDSPNALTSRWVYEELARAHNLGLGVLQLVWPNHS